MRKLLLPLLIIFCFTIVPSDLNSTVIRPGVATIHPSRSEDPKLNHLKLKDVEKALGRKLTLKERVVFFVLKKTKFAEKNNAGATAFIFGIIGAALLIAGIFIPFAIIGSFVAALLAVVIGSSAKKDNPNDKKARAAVLLGWITMGAIAFLLLLAAVVIATWSWV